MKKLNNIFKRFLVLINIVFLFILNGCNTLDVEPLDVNPLTLLDNNSSIYIAIPNGVDPQLLTYMLRNTVEGLSESDMQTVSQRIKTIYTGINRTKKGVDYQIAISTNIPSLAFVKSVKKTKGWTKDTISFENIKNQDTVIPTEKRSYDVYNVNNINLSMPDSNILCMGRDIPNMLECYHAFAHGINYSKVLEKDIFNWLSNANEEQKIKFYAKKPQQFLSVLIGTDIPIRLVQMQGQLYPDKTCDTQYIVDIDMTFQNERSLKQGKALIAIALGLTDSEYELLSDTRLLIKGIKIDKSQVYKVLVI